MGCSGRVKEDDIRPEQKWEFIARLPIRMQWLMLIIAESQ
jgi:hypothetical protein